MTRAEALRATCPLRMDSIQATYQANSSKPYVYIPQYAHCLASDCPKWQDERQSGGACRCERPDDMTVSDCQLDRGHTCAACPAIHGHCG